MKLLSQFIKESKQRRIILVSCGSEKHSGKHKAKDLYTGSLFTASLEYAQHIKQDNDRVYIVSGKYGLVPLDKEIESYDIYLPDQSEEYKEKWSEKIKTQFKRAGIDLENDVVISLCAETYNDLFRDYIRHLKEPLDGKSMGFRMQWLVDHTPEK